MSSSASEHGDLVAIVLVVAFTFIGSALVCARRRLPVPSTRTQLGRMIETEMVEVSGVIGMPVVVAERVSASLVRTDSAGDSGYDMRPLEFNHPGVICNTSIASEPHLAQSVQVHPSEFSRANHGDPFPLAAVAAVAPAGSSVLASGGKVFREAW